MQLKQIRRDVLRKSAWECRIALARLGFSTETRYVKDGYSGIWAKSWYWKGWISDVGIHETFSLKGDVAQQINRAVHAHRRILEAVLRASLEYPDTVPCMSHKDVDGWIGLTTNSWETENCTGPEKERRFYPTQKIPKGIETSKRGEALIAAQLANVRRGFYAEDKLNTHTGSFRYIQDCKDLEWAFHVRLSKRRHGGRSVKFNTQKYSSPIAPEAFCADFAQNCGVSLNRLFRGCGASELPPGFEWLNR